MTLANQLDKLISKGGKTDANTHEAEYLKLKTMQKQT